VSVALVSIGGGKFLAPAPAASYQRARAAGLPPGVTSAYRSPEYQAQLRARYLADPVNNAYAAPVADSEHVDGYALDLPAGGPREWMQAHGALHGWIRTDPRESWHFAYRLSRDAYRWAQPTPLPPPAPATPTPTPEDDVPTIIYAGTAGAYLLDGGQTKPLSPADLQNAESITPAWPRLVISPETFALWQRQPVTGLLVRSTAGSVAVSLCGAPFAPVTSPQDYADLLAQGIPAIPVSDELYADLTEGVTS
jgi:hypothetical protein